MADPAFRSPHPDAQERMWQAYVAQVGSGPAPAFEEDWARFEQIYAGRRARDGPPPAWWPSAERLDRANLAALMRERGFGSYGELHAWSVRERAEFWRQAIRRLGIVFAKEPVAMIGGPDDVRRPGWLHGAELNIVDSCFRAPAEATAVISGREGDGGLRKTSYGQLERLVNRVANGFVEQGLEPGDGVALYMPMNLECVAAYMGIVRAGGRVISIADSFAPAELARRVKIGAARAILTVASFARGGKSIALYEKVIEAESPQTIVMPEERGNGPQLRDGDILWEDFLSGVESCESRTADPYTVTNVLFSSGTTADPKAIPWTQLTPIKCAMDGHFHHDIHSDDVVAWPTNIGWMMGPWLIYATLINRAAMALYEGLPSGSGFARFVQEAGVTMLGTVPSLVRAWRSSGAVPEGFWEGVRTFSSTGEPSSREEYLWLMSRARYRAPVVEYCGGTEIGGGYITGTVVQPAAPATFTTPALGLDFVILDDDGNPVAEDGEGELYVVPPSIGLSEVLLNKGHDEVYYAGCPSGPDGAVLRRHGDQMVRLHRGFYRAHGRADDTMNLGGIKVSLLELERVVEGHARVYESAAVAVQLGGGGGEVLVVYVVPSGRFVVDELKGELGALIAKRINPLFKVHDVVVVDQLPRTASNKLMRRELRAEYLGRG